MLQFSPQKSRKRGQNPEQPEKTGYAIQKERNIPGPKGSIKPRFSKLLQEESHEQREENLEEKQDYLESVNSSCQNADTLQSALNPGHTLNILKGFSVGKHSQLCRSVVEEPWDLYKLCFHAKFPGGLLFP